MIKTAVARRYARALFELLDPATIEATQETLNGLGRALKESADLRYVLASPTFAADEKIVILAELSGRFHCPPEGRAFLGQLVRKHRIGFLPEIAEAFNRLVDQARKVQRVSVSSARALSPDEQEQMTAKLREALKREVAVTFRTDASLLAGIRVQIENKEVDGTVRGRLQDIRSLLAQA
ncbi:MAG: ATP synthase F1 subunit delta [Nitrospira sp.]|nr:ATP synthase F1 subunit delta [Nitrospira sp.]MCP9464874.1 ATP synthase F1 subunit delta [Nitrospira sp.]